ncbi:MAG: SDR family oxidoreductase [Novosphingobium sp.]
MGRPDEKSGILTGGTAGIGLSVVRRMLDEGARVLFRGQDERRGCVDEPHRRRPYPSYCAQKGAVINLTRAIAAYHAREDIRINALCPGFVATPATDAFKAFPQLLGDRFRSIPARRPARPEKMAGIVAFLASDDASYLHGHPRGRWRRHDRHRTADASPDRMKRPSPAPMNKDLFAIGRQTTTG